MDQHECAGSWHSANVIAEAVFRAVPQRAEGRRVIASKQLVVPKSTPQAEREIIDAVAHAFLYCSTICAYARASAHA